MRCPASKEKSCMASSSVIHRPILQPKQRPATQAVVGRVQKAEHPPRGAPPTEITTKNKAKNSTLPNKQKQGPAGVGGPLPQSPGTGCGPCLRQRNWWRFPIQEGSSVERLELRLWQETNPDAMTASSVILRSNLTSRTPYFPLSQRGPGSYLPTP